MPKIKYHRIAAILVLVATAAWIATGEFSSVGSASQEAEAARKAEAEKVAERPATLKTVQVARPPRLEHARTIRISGRTEAHKETVLAARATGIVEELPFSEGDLVAEGDLIMRLDPQGKDVAVESARQLLEQREAEAEAAERLADSGNIARLRLREARSAVASARSALETAKAELDRISVRAPFSGVIDAVHTEKGTALTQGDKVATLLQLDPILAVGEVSERNLGDIRRDDVAEVRLVTGATLSGRIRHVSRAASPQTRTYRVEVMIENPDRRIPAGMTAEINLLTQSVETVALPRSVITLNAEGELGVRAVDPEGVVHFYPIDIVDDTPGALYLAGIPADARIIVAGQDLVTEGETVNAVMADEETLRDLAGGPAVQKAMQR